MVIPWYTRLRYRVWHRCGYSTNWVLPVLTWGFGILIFSGAIAVLAGILSMIPVIPKSISDVLQTVMSGILILSVFSALFAISVSIVEMISNNYYDWKEDHTRNIEVALNRTDHR